MPQYAVKPCLVVPALVKGLKDVDKLQLVESIKVGNYGIQLMNHILLLIIHKGSILYTNRIRPSGKTLVGTRKTPRELHDALPEHTVAIRAWDWKRVKDEITDMSSTNLLAYQSRGMRRKNAEQECLVLSHLHAAKEDMVPDWQ